MKNGRPEGFTSIQYLLRDDISLHTRYFKSGLGREWIYVTDVWFLKWFGINVHLDKTAERIKVEWLGSNEWIPLDGSKSKIILLKSGSPHLQKIFQLLQIFWEIYNVERGTHNLKCPSLASFMENLNILAYFCSWDKWLLNMIKYGHKFEEV